MIFFLALIFVAIIREESRYPCITMSEKIGKVAGYCQAALIGLVIIVHLGERLQ